MFVRLLLFHVEQPVINVSRGTKSVYVKKI